MQLMSGISIPYKFYFIAQLTRNFIIPFLPVQQHKEYWLFFSKISQHFAPCLSVMTCMQKNDFVMTSLRKKYSEVFGAFISQITSIKKDDCLSERLTRHCFINRKIKGPQSHLQFAFTWEISLYLFYYCLDWQEKCPAQRNAIDCISLRTRGWRVADVASIGTDIGTKEHSQPNSSKALQKLSPHWEIHELHW